MTPSHRTLSTRLLLTSTLFALVNLPAAVHAADAPPQVLQPQPTIIAPSAPPLAVPAGLSAAEPASKAAGKAKSKAAGKARSPAAKPVKPAKKSKPARR